MRFLLALLGCAFSVSFSAHAQGTHLWTESTPADWEKGRPRAVSIGSDGVLSVGLPVSVAATFTAADVWAATSDEAGNAYVATGSPAQVVRVAPDGTQTVLFTTKNLSVQSLAVRGDSLYAATLPSARVFRIALRPGAKPLDDTSAPVVFDAAQTAAKPKYIWAMLFDPAGRLYLASGAPGAVYRVDPNAGPNNKPELVFESDEPHIRSLLLAPNGDLLAGSDGTGLVYRIEPSGKAFVLFEAPKREITSLSFGADGALYVAAVGEKGRLTTATPLPVGGVSAALTATVTVTVVQPGSTQAVSNNTAVPDGSEVYRLPASASEAPRRIWAGHDDVVYSLLSTKDGLLAATGNRGRVYRLHDDGSSEDVAHADTGQVIGFAPAPNGELYLPAANPAKLLRLGSSAAATGVLQSEVFDATEPALWGRAEVISDGGVGRGANSYTLEARTGNIDNPARNWSDWKPVRPTDPTLGQPGARFAQWRLTLEPGARVQSVALNYLPANAAPEVDEILVAPGTRVNAVANQPSYPQQTTLTFASQGGGAINLDNNSPQAPLSAIRDKGSVTARWAAHDDNGDELRFSVFFRGAGEPGWRLLKADLADRFYSFDANLLPDGPYRLRVIATDAPSHPPGAALSGERVSDLFQVSTATPHVTALSARRDGSSLHVTATATGTRASIARAEYSLDAAAWQYVDPVGRLSDAPTEQYDFAVPISGPAAPGPHILSLRVFDRFDSAGSAEISIP